MKLSDLSIKNPVFAWMLMFGLIIFGAIGLSRMGISQLPDVDFPVLTIRITWAGASPQTLETAVVDVLEDAVMSVEGIRNISSTSQEGVSTITIEFELNRDINTALQEVQTKILQAQRNLPNDIDPPIVTKSNPEDQPIMFTAISGATSLREMILLVRDRLKDNITTVEGVGDVFMGGYVDPNMRIWLDLEKMVRNEITVDDVISAVMDQHILTPSGFMDNKKREFNVRVLSEAQTVKDFENIIISTRRGAPIWTPLRLGDVAKIEESLADVRRIMRSSGKQSVGLGIIKQRGSNAVAVGHAIKERFVNWKKVLPEYIKSNIVWDSTKFIEESTYDLIFTLCLSVILTSLVCWIFLGSWSSAINVILAIPVSLIGSFIVLYFFGFTLNTFTLLGLSLSIGIVVDDAIMVMENIVRHFENKMSRVKAAIVGAREITAPAIAASLAILAIFLPVIFMKGIIGKFFLQFGVTMSVAVILSLIEALTLAPMRLSQFLTKKSKTRLGNRMDKIMEGFSIKYKRFLVICLNHRIKVIGLASVIFASSIILVFFIRKEFIPPQDQSRFYVTIQANIDSSIHQTDELIKKAEAIVAARPEIATYFSSTGVYGGGIVNTGSLNINMKEPSDRPVSPPFRRKPSQQEFMSYIRNQIAKIPGVVRVTVMDPSLSGFSAKRGFPIQFSVQGPDWEKLAAYSKQIMDIMIASKFVTDVDTDYKLGMPEIQIIPDRNKAMARGVTVTNIANTINATVGSMRVGKYTDEAGHRDDIRVKLLDKYNREQQDIRRIMVRNVAGEMVSLSNVVDIKEKSSLLTISRYNRERAVTIFANIAPKISQTDVMAFIENTAAKILPQDYHVIFAGSSQTFTESFQSLIIALVLGIAVAYMLLGSQFNSFIHPVTILLALPFSITGAFLALWLTDTSLNIYSMIGLLLLMGIVKKNSILLVDFTNKRRIDGMDVRSALLDACPIRLRPIIMTSIATIAAAIPPALAIGPGAETTRPMAIVVIGGVILSTLLTLLVVPCAYSLFSRFESKKHEKDLHEALVSLGEKPAKKKVDAF